MSDHEVPAAVWVYTDDEEDREFVVVHDYNARVIVEATDGLGGRASVHLTPSQAINLARALLDTSVTCMVYETLEQRMVEAHRRAYEDEMENQQRQHEAEIERMYAPYGGESPF